MADSTTADDVQLESGYSNDAPTATPAPAAEPEAKAAPEAVKSEPAVDPLQQLIERLDRMESGQNKLAGHIGGLTRTQKEIQERFAAADAATKVVADAPSQAEVTEAMQSPQEWEELKSQYPTWATATEKFMDAKLQALAKAPGALDPDAIGKLVSEQVAGESKAVRKEIIEASLSAVFPSWQEDINSPEFDTWLQTQGDDVKAWANSDSVRDAAMLLRKFELHKNQPAAPAAVTVDAKAKEVSTRQKRLEAAVLPRGTGGHAVGTTPDDEFEAGYSS